MPKFSIDHRTEYHYSEHVSLGPHRLMLRPRESRELRLISNKISTWPAADLSWAQDVFGNALATATFKKETDNLVIESETTLELESAAWPVFPIAARAATYPFSYSDDERTDLGALLTMQHPDPTRRLSAWAASFVMNNPTDTLALLKDLNAGISATASYQARDEEGTQSPTRTLDLGRGSCRDFALLFVEAARALGFGARAVSGYIFNPSLNSSPGTTHAWAEVFVPGAGWITFDPTNRRMGGFNLIPVAVARDLRQATPISGSFLSRSSNTARVQVAVHVKQI